MKRKRPCDEPRTPDQIAESRQAAEAISVTIRWLADACQTCHEKMGPVDHFCSSCLSPRPRDLGMDEVDNVLRSMGTISLKCEEETKRRSYAAKEARVIGELKAAYASALAAGPLQHAAARMMVDPTVRAARRVMETALRELGAVKTKCGWVSP